LSRRLAERGRERVAAVAQAPREFAAGPTGREKR